MNRDGKRLLTGSIPLAGFDMEKNRHTFFVVIVAILAGSWWLWHNRGDVIKLLRTIGLDSVADNLAAKANDEPAPVPNSFFYTRNQGGMIPGRLMTIPDPDNTDTSIYTNAQTGAQVSVMNGGSSGNNGTGERLFGSAG